MIVVLLVIAVKNLNSYLGNDSFYALIASTDNGVWFFCFQILPSHFPPEIVRCLYLLSVIN